MPDIEAQGGHGGQLGGGGRAEADAAIAAAVRAFEDGPWKDDHALRAKALEEIAAAFERHADALIDLLALENGKIKPEAAFEVGMVPGKLRYYAGLEVKEDAAALELSERTIAREWAFARAKLFELMGYGEDSGSQPHGS